MNLDELKKQLDLITGKLTDVEVRLEALGKRLPTQQDIQLLEQSVRQLHSQRATALRFLFGFAAITLVWLASVSCLPWIRPSSWLGLAAAVTPALVWLGLAGVILRSLRGLR